MNYIINIYRDSEAGVWIADSDDVPGLVLESDSLEALFKRIPMAIDDLTQ